MILPLLCVAWSYTSSAEEMPVVDCIITPSVTVDVSSPVPGTLSEVNVDRSDIVAQGQVIARLNSEVEQATVELARAKAALDSEVNLGEVNLVFDERKHKRFDSLYVKDVASSQDKDEAERNMALSKEKLKHSRELRRLRKLELLKAEAQLKQKSIRSPIQGVVVQRYKSVSEHVEDEAIVRIAQLNPLYVEAIVPMEQFGRINNGMQADVFFDAFKESPRRAKVTVVDQMGDAASGTFGVRLELPNPEYTLPAGLKCNVKILLDLPVQQAEKSDAVELKNNVKKDLVQNNPLTDESETGSAELAAIASCSSLGPFSSQSKAQQMASALETMGRAQSALEISPEMSQKYIVLAPMQENINQSRQLLERMKKAGVDDIALLWRGTYKHRVSLGVFNKERSYKERIHKLTQLGFETESHKLSQKTGNWWLDISQPVSAPEITALTEAHPDVMAGTKARPFACRPQTTAITASR